MPIPNKRKWKEPGNPQAQQFTDIILAQMSNVADPAGDPTAPIRGVQQARERAFQGERERTSRDYDQFTREEAQGAATARAKTMMDYRTGERKAGYARDDELYNTRPQMFNMGKEVLSSVGGGIPESVYKSPYVPKVTQTDPYKDTFTQDEAGKVTQTGTAKVKPVKPQGYMNLGKGYYLNEDTGQTERVDDYPDDDTDSKTKGADKTRALDILAGIAGREDATPEEALIAAREYGAPGTVKMAKDAYYTATGFDIQALEDTIALSAGNMLNNPDAVNIEDYDYMIKAIDQISGKEWEAMLDSGVRDQLVAVRDYLEMYPPEEPEKRQRSIELYNKMDRMGL